MPNLGRYGLTIMTSALEPPSGDKTIVVPENTQWWLHSIVVEYQTLEQAGMRELYLTVMNEADEVYYFLRSGVTQANSLTRFYLFAPGNPNETGFTDDLILRSMSDHLYLLPGWKLRGRDRNNVAPASDVIILRSQVELAQI